MAEKEKVKIWNDARISAIKFGEKTEEYRIDSGLYLSVSPKTSTCPTKTWWSRGKNKNSGKQIRQKIGIYEPSMTDIHVSLAEARKLATDWQKALRLGLEIRKIPTFREVVCEWKEKYKEEKRKSTIKNNMNRFKKYIENSDIWQKEIDKISKADIVSVVRLAPPAVGKKLLTLLNSIFEFAEASGVFDGDIPVPPQKKIIPQKKVKHLPAITDLPRLQQLFAAIKDDVKCSPIDARANLFLAYCFPRPWEMRNIKWEQIDWKKREIRIPVDNVKTARPLVIPMAKQVEEMLEEMLFERKKDEKTPFSEAEYVFHVKKSYTKPIWDTYPMKRLLRLGFSSEEHCSHGFRSVASTFLRTALHFREEVIEAQLDHSTGTAVSRIYNRADWMEERRVMLQKWADWVDKQAKIGGEKMKK